MGRLSMERSTFRWDGTRFVETRTKYAPLVGNIEPLIPVLVEKYGAYYDKDFGTYMVPRYCFLEAQKEVNECKWKPSRNRLRK